MLKCAKYSLNHEGVPEPEKLAAWLTNDRRLHLNKSECLKVFFMNKCPENWGHCISHEQIMKFLEDSWIGRFTHCHEDETPQICVKFEGIQ